MWYPEPSTGLDDAFRGWHIHAATPTNEHGSHSIRPIWQTARVGFNPHSKQRRRNSDYVLVAVTLALIAALVIWGFTG
jgi:hypothetical protein